MTELLGSWTRTLNEEDAITLLLDTVPGESLSGWQARAHADLPQANRARRNDTIRIVRESLLDLRDDTILRSTWLRLFHEGNPHRRRNLLYGRLHARRPWIVRAVDQLVLPHLSRADEPLAPHDADLVTPDEWAAFFAANLDPRTPSEATKKTRSIVPRNLANLGALSISASTTRETRVRHTEPDPSAFGWLLWHELTTEGRTEAPESWAVTDSLAARLFATRRAYAERCVENAVASGLLTRGYLAGMSRLHPSAESP